MTFDPAEEYDLYDIEDLINPEGALGGGLPAASGARDEPAQPARPARRSRPLGWLGRLPGRLLGRSGC